MTVDTKSDSTFIIAGGSGSVTFNRGNATRQELIIVNDSGTTLNWTYTALLRKNWQYVSNALAAGPLLFYPGEIVPGSSFGELTNRGASGAVPIVRAGQFMAAPVSQVGVFLTLPTDPQFNATIGEWGGNPRLLLSPTGAIIGNFALGFAIEIWAFYGAAPGVAATLFAEYNPAITHYIQFKMDTNMTPTVQLNNGVTNRNLLGIADFGFAANAISLNNWHHIVLNFLGTNGSPVNGWDVYIDGVKGNPTTPTFALPFFLDTSSVQFGELAAIRNFFAPAVYPAPLTAQRIQQHYQSLNTATWFAQIDTGSLAGGQSTARAYGAGTAMPIPDVAQLTFSATSSDSHGGWASRLTA